MEQFKDINGFPGYMIGENGNVFSKKSDRIIRGSLDKARNRPKVNLVKDGKSYQRKVHRLVAEHFLPPPKHDQTSVRHLNDDPMDNRAANLAWGTHTDNMQDKVRNGNSGKGSRNGNAKLTEEQAAEIINSHLPTGALAATYSISEGHVRRLRSGKRWGHLKIS